MLTALQISLTACLPCSCGLAAQDLPLPLTPILSTSLMQYSQSFIPFSGKLWNSLPASVFPPAVAMLSRVLAAPGCKVERLLCTNGLTGSKGWQGTPGQKF